MTPDHKPAVGKATLLGSGCHSTTAMNLNRKIMPLTFEQQPRESNKAFAAFKTYLELGPERSLVAVADKHGKSKTMMEKWSRKFDWPARVQAHAAHLAMVERQAIEALAVEKAVDWSKVHESVRIAEWNRHKKLIALADEILARWEKNKAKCGTLEGIARILELASKLGRLAAGMPTDVKEVNTTMTATIDVDWEVAIKKAYGVAAPPGNDPAIVDVEVLTGGDTKA